MKKVEVIRDFPEVELVRRKIGPFNEGEEIQLRSWEASILEKKGFVKSIDDFSPTSLRKLLIREEKSSQLEDLSTSFYRTVSREVEKLREEGDIEDANKLRETVNSLIDFRAQKLAKMVFSSVEIGEVPREERILVNFLSQALNIWRQRIDRLFEKS